MKVLPGSKLFRLFATILAAFLLAGQCAVSARPPAAAAQESIQEASPQAKSQPGPPRWEPHTLHPVAGTAAQTSSHEKQDANSHIVAPSANTALTETGHITGTVTAEVGGAALVDISVYGYQYNDTYGYWSLMSSATTDSSGQYDISGLEADTYRVQFHDDSGIYAKEYYDNVPYVQSATDIPVTPGTPTTPVDSALSIAGHITGTVTAENGGALLSGITARAYRFNPHTGDWEYYTYAPTGADGQYDIGGLPADSYRIQFTDQLQMYLSEYYEDVLDVEDAADILVTPGTPTPPVDATLSEAGHITGTVTAEDGGALLAGIRVTSSHYITEYGYWASFSTETDGSGQYSIDGLRADIYRIRFEDSSGTYLDEVYDNAPDFDSATDIPVTPGTPTPPVDAALAQAGHITGTVTAEIGGAPLVDIEVEAYLYDAVDGEWDYYNYAATDASGHYDIGSLAAGTYRIGFWDYSGAYLTEYYNNVPEIDSADDVVVTPGTPTPPVDAALAQGGRISGTVTAVDGGAPIPDLYVRAYLYNNQYGDWETYTTEYTDETGQYSIGSLPAGTYRIGFWDYTGTYLDEYYDNAPDVDSADDILVTPGTPLPPVDAQLAGAGHITGTITAEVGGAPLAGIAVVTYYYNSENGGWEFLYVFFTDADGEYDVSSLPMGTYRVEFRDYSGSYLTEYYNDAPDVDSADDIAVTPGTPGSPVDAQLAAAGHITGTVTAEFGGAPLSGIGVQARYYDDQNGSWNYFSSDSTDASGQYDIGSLTAGTYRVSFYDYSGTYLPEYYNDAPDIDSADDIAVTPGTPGSPVDAALAAAGQITGTVTAVDGGAPLSGINVAVYVYDSISGDWDHYKSDSTDAGGQYDIGGLPADTYRVRFRDYSGTYLTEYYDNAPDVNSADDIPVTPGTPTPPADAALASLYTQHCISLQVGWNMISSYVIPDDPTLVNLLAGIEGGIVLLKNGAGDVYWPAQSIDEIGDWNPLDGYQINMQTAAPLCIDGMRSNPVSMPLDLPQGWSLIGYLPDHSMSIDQALSTVAVELRLAKDGDGQVYWPAYSVNQIGEMQPGHGYKLFLEEAAELTYP